MERETTEQYDADELGQYRSLSSMAVLAALLGCCSVLMFASPLMVVIPLGAIAAALLALRSIASSGGGLTGARLALVGLALATLFASAAFARVQMRERLLLQQTCEQWLDLASRGQVDDMLGLMTPSAGAKLKPEMDVAQPESFFSGMLSSALMRQDPLVVTMSDLAQAGEVNLFVDESQVLATATPPQALLKYVLNGRVAKSGEAEEVSVGIIIKRFQAGPNDKTWLIDSWSLEN